MLVTELYSGSLSISVCDPTNDTFYNWSTGKFTTPFSQSAHLQSMTPLEASPSVHSTILKYDVGTVMQSNPNAMAVIYTGSGASLAVYDLYYVWPPSSNTYYGQAQTANIYNRQ